MLLKNTTPIITGVALCMIITSAYAQAPLPDQQAVITAQQAAQNAYQQLQQDQQAGNTAAVTADQTALNTARTNLQTALETARVANENSPDGQAVKTDQQAVQNANQQLLRDQQVGNTAAVAADQTALNTAKTNLQKAAQTDMAANDYIFEDPDASRRHRHGLNGSTAGNQKGVSNVQSTMAPATPAVAPATSTRK